MKVMEIVCLLLIVAIFAIITIGVMFSSRCPKCKKFFALKYSYEKLVGKEPISKIEKLQIKDKKGQVIGTQEQRIYGTREKHKKFYICKHCKSTTVKYQDIDVY
ncbi:MAG: hypothetical protein J6C39_04935 [Clostridia bacterium]|nr:hypothetical protein [Clostridia bacterium]MBO5207671.1 hypothetical protein [Clostridia bacterium]MBP3582961.1 hypothetical protein [Clostridia bacterium]